MSDFAETVHQLFEDNNWEFSGYGVPEVQDVKTVLETCASHLEEKPEGTVIEVGNIAVRKGGGKYHLYMLLGTYGE